MAIIIDRRKNPEGKSDKNRQKFLRRARDQIKKTIKDTVADKELRNIGKSNKDVIIKSKDINEPTFRKDYNTGDHERVLPGNKQYQEGDSIPKPRNGGGGAGGKKAGSGDGLDDFEFTLTKEEFLNYLFEDLELPYFIKETLQTTTKTKNTRMGLTNEGSPANLNVEKTFKKSISRRLALHRPTDDEIQEIKNKLKEYETWDELSEQDKINQREMKDRLEYLEGRRRVVPFIDDKDLRYNLWQKKPNPESQAVMFCLMDVSGSMGETEKDISKRFFLILYLFLEKKYEKVDIRFVRHTESAEEVDENTFFYDTQSGGTKISSGLECINDIIKEQYDPADWNVYIAQCTDGDNSPEDNIKCESILQDVLLPIVQYFAYIEVSQYDRNGFMSGYNAWPLYLKLSEKYRNIVAKKIRNKSKVWTVFNELFRKRNP